jgi:hypothetical protein
VTTPDNLLIYEAAAAGAAFGAVCTALVVGIVFAWATNRRQRK